MEYSQISAASFYKEGLDYTHIRVTKDESFVLYKGFKILKNKGEYTMLDCRYCDNYDNVSKQNIKIFNELGFIQGADLIQYRSALKSFVLIKEKLTATQIKSSLKEDQNFQRKLSEYENKLRYYTRKIRNYETKYNIPKQSGLID